MYRFRDFLRVLAVALIAVFLETGVGLSHASLNSTQPVDGSMLETPPAAFMLTFSEPVAPLSLRLIRPDGSSTELASFVVKGNSVEIVPPSDMGSGTHVLSWRVVSADGHPIGGSLVFSIGEASAAPPTVPKTADTTARTGLWLTKVALYVGFFLGVGGALTISWLYPRSRAGSSIVLSFLSIGLAGTALSPGFQGLDALGAPLSSYVDETVWQAAMETSYGQTVGLMLVALLLAIFATMDRSSAHARLVSLAGVLAGAGALAMSGHASAASPQWLMRPAVFIHAATIAFWAGALVPLALALRADGSDALAGLRRFSATIPYALGGLIAAGLAMTVVQVETPSALFDTAYGRLLLAKLAVIAVLLALAAFNRWRLTAPAIDPSFSSRRGLVRVIGIETLLVLVIFAIAAGWRFTPPPRSLAVAAAVPAQTHIHTLEAMADVTITPGRAGPVSVSAILMTGEFGALDAKKVTYVFANPAAGIEPFRREASKPGDGSWLTEGVVLPVPGKWTLGIDILVDDFTIVRIEGEIEIRP